MNVLRAVGAHHCPMSVLESCVTTVALTLREGVSHCPMSVLES